MIRQIKKIKLKLACGRKSTLLYLTYVNNWGIGKKKGIFIHLFSFQKEGKKKQKTENKLFFSVLFFLFLTEYQLNERHRLKLIPGLEIMFSLFRLFQLCKRKLNEKTLKTIILWEN